MASTHVLPQGPPAQQAVASWIIVLSVLAGAALLSLCAYGLYKVRSSILNFSIDLESKFCPFDSWRVHSWKSVGWVLQAAADPAGRTNMLRRQRRSR